MQTKVIVFILSFVAFRFYLTDLVTNDYAIQRRGNQIMSIAKNRVISNCEKFTTKLTSK